MINRSTDQNDSHGQHGPFTGPSGTQPPAQLARSAEPLVLVDKQVLGSMEGHGVSFNEFRASVPSASDLYAVHGDARARVRATQK